jgi:O-antigen/teichoic acid export membrane protein
MSLKIWMRHSGSKILATLCARERRARLLHMSQSQPYASLQRAEPLTVDETSFPNAKLRNTFLIAYKAFADLAGKGSLFVITIAAARRLSPQAFGIFSLGVTLGWLVAVASDFGIQLHLARAVATRPESAERLLRAWLRVRLWTAAGTVALVATGLFSWGRSASHAVPIVVLALVYALSGLIELLNYFYRGLSRSDIESSLTLWQRSTTLVCALAVLAWRPDVTLLAIAMLLPVAATLAVSLRIAARLSRGSTRAFTVYDDAFSAVRATKAFVTGSEGLREVWPIGAGIVLSALYFRIDVFLVQLWAGTESVARYNAVFRLVEALRLFPAAVLAVALPSLCRATDLRAVTRVAAPVTAFALAVTVVLWVTSGWLVPLLYGARYADAVPAFRILLLAFPLLSLNYALTHQLVGWNGQRAYAAVCAFALVVNIALNARLIPAWSIEGAAWATLGTEVFLTAGCLVALWTLVSRPIVEQAVMG